MKRNIKDNAYLNICDWMMKLGLTSKELLIYALIYSNSMDGVNDYHGSSQYLAAWTQGTKKTVFRNLQNLEEKGLIKKTQYKIPGRQIVCAYQVTEPRGDTKNFDCITIYPFMINEFGLKDRELLLYAMIYGFSKKGSDSWFTGSLEYIAEWLNIPTKNARLIRDRYLTPMQRRGLLKISKNGYWSKYRAILPENKEQDFHQNDTTLQEEDISHDFHQNDSTFVQNDTTISIKMTPNILRDILVDDNVSSNNNTVYTSKEELSVVVNEDIDTDSLKGFSQEEECFTFKQELDFKLYNAFSKKAKGFDLALFMQKYALSFYRRSAIAFLSNNISDLSKDDITAVGTLMVKTITNRKFEKEGKLISELTKNECKDLLNEAFRLLDPEECPSIRRSKEAYMIGVLSNILQET